MVKWCPTITIDRVQTCPGVAKELEAGHAVSRRFVCQAQVMKRRSTKIIGCIWRHTFRKQSAERLDVTLVCGSVDGCHRVTPGEGHTKST